MVKKLIKSLTLALGILTIFSPLASASADVNLIIKGSYLDESLSEIKNSRTYLPLRLVAESLGYDVAFDQDTKEIKISDASKEVLLYLDSDTAKVDQEEYKLEEKPYLKEDRTMVPLRFVAESMGQEVNWNQGSMTAIVGRADDGDPKGRKINLPPLYGHVTLPSDWEKDIDLSYDFSSQGDLAIISKKLKAYLEKNNLDGDGVIFLVENSASPFLDSFGLNLAYSPEIERFIYLTKHTIKAFPEEISEEITKIQEKYVEAFKSLDFSKDLGKDLPDYKILRPSDPRKDLVKNVEKIKNLMVPWYYFENTIAYVKEEGSKEKIFLPNYKDLGSKKLSSKVELTYDENGSLEKFLLKFYERPEKLAYFNFSDAYAQREIRLFMREILGYDENEGNLSLDHKGLFGDYENEVYHAYKDSFGNKYIFNMTSGYLEYMSK